MSLTLKPSRAIRIPCLAAALLLSACSILPQSQTLTIYQLPAAQTAQQATGNTGINPSLSLRVTTPYSSQAIDTTRIVVVPQGSQISAYSGVRWSDPGPVLVRNRLAGAFRADGRLASVSVDSGDSRDSDFELSGDLAAFQTVYENGAPVVHVRYDASLIQSSSNRSVAVRSFDIAEPVQGKEVPEVVQAFGRAADRLAAEVVAWTLQRAKAAGTSR